MSLIHCQACGELHDQGRTCSRSPWNDLAGNIIPEWAAQEIRETWNKARSSDGQLEAFRILERMVDRLGYGRTENNPPLFLNNQIKE